MKPTAKTSVFSNYTYSPADQLDQSQDEPLDQLVAQLFTQHSESICAYIHVLVNDWQLAQELTQESYLRLYRARSRLPDVENQRAWLYRISHNVAMTELRRRRRFAWLPWNASDQEFPFSWVESTQQVDDRTDIEDALRLMPEHYRAPLMLYSGHGLSVKEVAETLGLSESAVKVRLHRAREMFRKLYTQADPSHLSDHDSEDAS